MPSLEVVHRKAAGLQTAPSSSVAPEGALVVARNATSDRPGIVSSRRGVKTYSSLSNAGTGIWEYLGKAVILDGSTLKYDVSGTGSLSSWSGSYSPPTGQRMRAIEIDGKFYFTTSNGVFVQESPTGTPHRAGVDQGIILKYSLVHSASGWLYPGKQASYRIAWAWVEGQVLGPPSEQEVVYNPITDVTLAKSSTTITVTHTAHGYSTGWYIEISNLADSTYINGSHQITVLTSDTYSYTVSVEPTDASTTGQAGYRATVDFNIRNVVGLPTGPWWELYRTISSDSWPGDTHYLIKKAETWGTDYFAYTDITDDAFLTASSENGQPVELYTNPATQEGIRGASFRPPYCHFLENWRGHLFFSGGVKWEPQLSIKLDTLAYLDIDDTISVGGQVYTCKTTESGPSKYFQKWTSDPLESVNIRKTMKSLCYVINYNTSSNVWAHYTWDEVGKIRLVAKDFTVSTQYVKASDSSLGNSFTPPLPTTDTLPLTSQIRLDVVCRSKFQKPSAVPLLSYSEVGKLGQDVYGLQGLTDSLLVFPYAGIYEITGETDGNFGNSFVVREVDRTLRLINSGCLGALDAVGVGWFNGGICRVSGASSLIISTPIDQQPKRIAKFSAFSLAFFVPWESEHKLLVWLPSTNSATYPDHCYIYDYINNHWFGPWEIPSKAAAVIGDKLYICRANKTRLVQERRDYASTDFRDEDESTTVSAFGTAQVPLLSFGTTYRTVSTATVSWTDATPIAPGWLFTQGSQSACVRTATDNLDNTFSLVLDEQITIANGAATVAPSIEMEVQWAEEDAGDATVEKHFSRVIFAFDAPAPRHNLAGFSSNRFGTQEWTYEFEYATQADDGSGAALKAAPVLSPVPQDSARAEELRVSYRHRQALEEVQLKALSIWFIPTAPSPTRSGR